MEEKSDRYTIEAEVPGLRSDEIEIDLNGNVLTGKGERKQEEHTDNRDRKMHMVERHYGSFQRSITLPDHIDPDGITAENRNGVLYIDVPKDKKSEPRRIDIKNREE